MTVYGTALLEFWPRFNGTTELAVEIEVVDIKFTGGIAVNNFIASADISTFLVDKINVLTSTIGNISTMKLKLEFNTASRVLVPMLNKWLQKYEIPIPSNILGMFTLSDLVLTYMDGYLAAGATPTFIAPTAISPINSVNEVALRLEQF